MMKFTKIKAVLAALLIAVLLVPQGVFAAPAKPEAVFRPGEVIFKTAGNKAEADILRKYNLTLIRRDRRLGYVLAAAGAGTDTWQVVSRLRKEKNVRYAQPNYIYKLLGRPNDPQLSRQWALPEIKAGQGWGAVQKAAPVTIAVLDTGIDVNHPDLKNRLVPGMNTVNPLKSSRDSDGHGTHVAGIAGAAINNGLGIAGVAGITGIKIMPVKVFDDGGGSDTTISDGIIWAVDHGAQVINMSFGSFYESEVLNEAINYAYDRGVVLVAAAGNWASQEISYPAALAKVIAVSATNKEGRLADFSSYGPQIDVSAPGDRIYSTYWDPYKGSTYAEMSGTSMASPMVAGLAALLKAKDPNLTNGDIRQIIEVSAVDLGDPGWDPQYGHGRIDVYKALTTSLAKYDDGNSSMENAVNLSSGTAYREKINTGNDVDWYKISLPEQANLQIEVLPAGKVTPGVEIYDSAGAVLASFNCIETKEDAKMPYWIDDGRAGRMKVAQAVYGLVGDLEQGDYYIKVFGNHFRWSEEDYTVTAQVLAEADLAGDAYEPNDSFQQAKAIELGTIVNGAIQSGSDEDWFKVNLTRGAYKIQLTSPGGLDLAVDAESEYNYLEPLEDGDLWDYYEKWFRQTVDNAGQGGSEEGVIVVPDNGGGKYYLRVYDTGGNAVNGAYALKITGLRLRADNFEGNDTWKAAKNIKLGEEIKANFHQQSDQDWYRLTVPGTGILTVDLDMPPNLQAELALYGDPEAEFGDDGFYGFGYGDFGRSDGDGGVRTRQFKVTGGDYYLYLHNYGPAAAEDYSLKPRFNPYSFIDPEINDTPRQAGLINIGESRQGNLYPDEDLDFYVLEVAKPGPYLVYVTPPAGLDTYVVVGKETEPDSLGEEPLIEPVTEINNGSKGQPDTGVFMATKPGKYYIGVMAMSDKLTGVLAKSQDRYSLVINPFKAVPDAWENNDTMAQARPIPDRTAIRPTFMGTEDSDWFKINIPGAGRLVVNLTVPEDIDGVVEVFDSAGRFMGKIDQSVAGEEEQGSFAVAKPGYYYIRAYDYLGNSSVQSYTLTARYVETVPPKVTGVKVTGRSITFGISEDSRIFVKILNGNDAFVAMALDGTEMKKGRVTAVWDARDASGRMVSPGRYKVKIVAIDRSGNMSQPMYVTVKV